MSELNKYKAMEYAAGMRNVDPAAFFGELTTAGSPAWKTAGAVSYCAANLT